MVVLLPQFELISRGIAARQVRWLGLWCALFSLIGIGVAHAGPAPVKPTPVKPTPVRPAAVKPAPAKPAAAKPAAAKPATQPAAAKRTSDPFTASSKSTSSPAAAGTADVRQTELYGDRLDGLQVEVDQLKDKIFRSKARLTMLKETVLRGVLAGSRVKITHRNLMGSSFRLVRVVYKLDGAQIFARTDETGSLDGQDEVIVYDGNLPAGEHELEVELSYQGHGYGLFSYLSGYTFESKSSHSFKAPQNGAVQVASIGFERGNLTTEMKDRPSVSWQQVPLDASGRPLPKTRTGQDEKKSR